MNKCAKVSGRRIQLGHLLGLDVVGHGLEDPLRPPYERLNARGLWVSGNNQRTVSIHSMGTWRSDCQAGNHCLSARFNFQPD